ncbi:hypothetical protein V1520DRAFT_340744 [Lipomyces starkeyi]|uniref:Uncharacterized protein n=1 Tax=Lipomyces starkeyi NRRL Y-11557 TaxID=675824 RepID=A0A1E3Q3E7_LIPST|nr:hypothetical protein LIPSTDRAFT_72923 [Lipomyces starkeyi NRRL Y-11557]
MLLRPIRQTRLFLLVFAALCFGVNLYYSSRIYGPLGAGLWTTKSSRNAIDTTPPTVRTPRGCVDPYKMPGYMYTTEDREKTRWIPFYPSFFDLPALPETAYPHPEDMGDILLNNRAVDDVILNTAPVPWFRMMREYYAYLKKVADAKESHQPEPELSAQEEFVRVHMSWTKNRRILLMGDSLDRNQLQYICEDMGHEFVEEGGPYRTKQTTAYCHIPLINITFVQWHIAGMYTFRPKWWWMPMKLVSFEDRFKEIFEPVSMHRVIGPSGSGPDLILMQSGLWDQVAFLSGAHFHRMQALPENNRTKFVIGRPREPLTVDQLRFVSKRFIKFVEFMKDVFGDNVPMMYRSSNVRKDGKDEDAGILSIDRMLRSLVTTRFNMEIFDWSRLAYGATSEYKDFIHFSKGRMSWLFSDMLLHYLFRASGGVEIEGVVKTWPQEKTMHDLKANWEVCHDYLVDTTNR